MILLLHSPFSFFFSLHFSNTNIHITTQTTPFHPSPPTIRRPNPFSWITFLLIILYIYKGKRGTQKKPSLPRVALVSHVTPTSYT